MKLIIGNKNYSSWSLRAWLCVQYFQVPFEEVGVSLNADGLTERLRQFSPTARVPVLVDGALTVWDSLAICEYVSDSFLEGQGWPTDAKVRSQARAVACEMHAGFLALRQEMPMNCRATRRIERSPALERDVARIDQMWTSLRQEWGDGGPWLFGRFTIADCMYAPVVFRFNTYDATLSALSQDYMNTTLQSDPIQQWLSAALQETEVLPEEEVGVDV